MTSSIKIPLYEIPSQGQQRFRKYFLYTLVITIILIAIFYLYKSSTQEAETSFIMLPFLLIYPIFGYWDIKNKEKFFIQIEANKISFKNSNWVGFHELQATEIQFIDINLTDIHISTNDLRSFDIKIGFAKHSDIQSIKEKLSAFRLKLLN